MSLYGSSRRPLSTEDYLRVIFEEADRRRNRDHTPRTLQPDGSQTTEDWLREIVFGTERPESTATPDARATVPPAPGISPTPATAVPADGISIAEAGLSPKEPSSPLPYGWGTTLFPGRDALRKSAKEQALAKRGSGSTSVSDVAENFPGTLLTVDAAHRKKSSPGRTEWLHPTSPEPAAAMLDENTKIRNRGFGTVDAVQNRIVKPFPYVTLLPLDKVADYVRNTPANQRERNMRNLPMWDIGPYNINASYGYEIFEKQVLDPQAKNPLKDFALKGLPADATDEEKWNAYRDRCLLGEKGGAYVTAAVLREGQKRLTPYMRNSTPEERAALLVTYFKQGWEKMQENYLARIKSTGEKSDMRPGEGTILFNNINDIKRILQGGFIRFPHKMR